MKNEDFSNDLVFTFINFNYLLDVRFRPIVVINKTMVLFIFL